MGAARCSCPPWRARGLQPPAPAPKGELDSALPTWKPHRLRMAHAQGIVAESRIVMAPLRGEGRSLHGWFRFSVEVWMLFARWSPSEIAKTVPWVRLAGQNPCFSVPYSADCLGVRPARIRARVLEGRNSSQLYGVAGPFAKFFTPRTRNRCVEPASVLYRERRMRPLPLP